MLNVSDAYATAAKSGLQRSRIKVELGDFGITGDGTGSVSAVLTEDDVVECVVECSAGESGAFGIGSTESCECSLRLLTSSARPHLGGITGTDFRVSYGYELDNGSVEWAVMGVFATDRSMVEKSGMYTDITMYDRLYWLGASAFTGLSFTRGESVLLRSMLDELCDAVGLEVSSESYGVVGSLSYSMMRPRADDGATVRSAIGDIATMCFACATAYDNRLHLFRLPDPESSAPVDKLTPDDFRDIPSFDFAESCASTMTATVTESSQYTAESPGKLAMPSCKLVRASSKVGKLVVGNARKTKAWLNSHYVLYIYRPSNAKGACGVSDTDSPGSMPWATVKATTGSGKGKTISQLYKDKEILGTVVGQNVVALGRRTLEYERYGKTVYLKGKNTKFFPAYSEGGKSYKGTFSAIANVKGPGNKSANRQKDWAKISEWRGEDSTVLMEFDGGSPVFSDGGSDSDLDAETGNSVELAPELFADGGTVNTLMSEGDLRKVEADFRTLCSVSAIPYRYVGSSTSMFGRNHYSVGDLLEVTDVYGDTYNVPVMSVRSTYGGAVLTEVSCDGLETDTGAGSYGGSASTSSKADEASNKADAAKDKADDADEKANASIDLAAKASESAKKAIEKASELDSISYRMEVDSIAAGQLASESYDLAHPIVDGMRSALEQTAQQAHEATATKEALSKTVEVTTGLARAVATYGYETEKSAVRWKQTYYATQDAWASQDPDVQAQIKEAYAKLYGEGGTAESPTEDSAQGHLNAAKAANVEAAATEAQMKTELASAQAYLASCNAQLAKDEASYKAAKAAYDKARKKTTAKRKEVDAQQSALNAAKVRRDASAASVEEAEQRCTEAEAGYARAKAARADAEGKVDKAQEEVDTVMNGIHELYSSTIEQTALSVTTTVEEIDTAKDGSKTLKQGIQKITADAIKSIVISGKDGTTVTQTATGWEVSSTDTAKGHMSYLPSTNTLTLGGSDTSKIVLGGKGALVCTSLTIGPSTVSSIDDLKGDKGEKGEKGDKGQTGSTGPQGPQGPQGPAGTDVTSQYVIYESNGTNAGINITYSANSVSGYHTNVSTSGLRMMNGTTEIASFTSDSNYALLKFPDGTISADKSPRYDIDRPFRIEKSGGCHIYIYKSASSGVDVGNAKFWCGDLSCSDVYASVISCSRLASDTIVRDSGTVSFAVNTSSNSYNVGLRAYGSTGNPSRHGLYTGTGASTDFDKWMVYADGSGGTTVNSSSSRFKKENIHVLPEDRALKLLDSEVVCFDYKLGEGEDDYEGRRGWVGFIAEDMYGIIPGAVTCRDEYEDLETRIAAGEDTSKLGIDYITFVPYLVKLCQMQQKQIDDLTARVEALERSVLAPAQDVTQGA